TVQMIGAKHPANGPGCREGEDSDLEGALRLPAGRAERADGESQKGTEQNGRKRSPPIHLAIRRPTFLSRSVPSVRVVPGRRPYAKDRPQRMGLAALLNLIAPPPPFGALQVLRLTQLRTVRFVEDSPRQTRALDDIRRPVVHTEPVPRPGIHGNELVKNVRV